MSFADYASIEYGLELLNRYQTVAYPLLFLGAYFETLIPFSFIIYGEIFFISGAVLAGTGTLDIGTVAMCLYAGGILGDNTSYWLGRRYGTSLVDMIATWPVAGRYVTEKNYAQAVSFFHRKGQAAVFVARLSGPFSWFVPALAGVFKQPYNRFLIFNTCGVIVGIGEFLIAGYLFGSQIDNIYNWLSRFSVLPLLLGVVFLAGLWVYRLNRRSKQAPGAVGQHRLF